MAFALPLGQTQVPTLSGAYIVYLMVALVVDLILAVVCGKLLQESGRSFWLGFLLGFLCGIFGLLVAIALYFTSDRRQPQMMKPMEHYGYGSPILPPSSPMDMDYGGGVCTQCQAPMPIGSEFCPNCGNYVAAQPQQPYAQQPYAQQPYAQQPYPQQPYPQQPYSGPPQSAPPAPTQPGMPPQPGTMKVCPLCNSKVPASAPSCSTCGTELSGTSTW
jgi:ribosomal protein L40E